MDNRTLCRECGHWIRDQASHQNTCGTIDVCIPTKESEDVIEKTLCKLHQTLEAADVSLNRLVIVDDQSDDNTIPLAISVCEENKWNYKIIKRESSLTGARKELINRVETEWFLFLDDDVRLERDYITKQRGCIGRNVGAVQGRKESRDEHPSRWVRRRARRGGTHATLIRSDAVHGIDYPSDMSVLEDEWTRRFIEEQEYVWVLNHLARFYHESQERHPIGWDEGRIAGKYNLAPFHQYVLNVPFSIVTKRNPIPHMSRSVGWIYGRITA